MQTNRNKSGSLDPQVFDVAALMYESTVKRKTEQLDAIIAACRDFLVRGFVVHKVAKYYEVSAASVSRTSTAIRAIADNKDLMDEFNNHTSTGKLGPSQPPLQLVTGWELTDAEAEVITKMRARESLGLKKDILIVAHAYLEHLSESNDDDMLGTFSVFINKEIDHAMVNTGEVKNLALGSCINYEGDACWVDEDKITSLYDNIHSITIDLPKVA